MAQRLGRSPDAGYPGVRYARRSGSIILFAFRFPVFREVRDRALILEQLVDFAERFQVRIRDYGALIGSTRSLTVAALFGRIRGYGALIGVPFWSGSPVGCARKEWLRRYSRGFEARQVLLCLAVTYCRGCYSLDELANGLGNLTVGGLRAARYKVSERLKSTAAAELRSAVKALVQAIRNTDKLK